MLKFGRVNKQRMVRFTTSRGGVYMSQEMFQMFFFGGGGGEFLEMPSHLVAIITLS